MRKATIFWLSLAAVCGTLLFHTSQEVTDGRTTLRAMERELLREEESLRVLQAEWSYLNQPERLEKLAREYLDLAPLTGKQFARISDINERIDEKALAEAAATDTTAAIEPAAGIKEEPVANAEPSRIVPPTPARTKAPSVTTSTATRPAVMAAPVPPVKAAFSAQPAIPAAATPRAFDDVLKNLGAN